MAVTTIHEDRCDELVRRVARRLKPELRYAGQGLRFEIGERDDGAGLAYMKARDNYVGEFAFLTDVQDGLTKLQLGPLVRYQTVRHTVLLIPVRTEIVGYRFYRALLQTVEESLYIADPDCHSMLAVVSDPAEYL